MRLITDAAVPSPGRGEVLIRVAVAGVNFPDFSRAYGTFLGGPQPPYRAGFEAEAEVDPLAGLLPLGKSVTSSIPVQRIEKLSVELRPGGRSGPPGLVHNAPHLRALGTHSPLALCPQSGAHAGGDVAPLMALARDVLEASGGPLFDGYRASGKALLEKFEIDAERRSSA
jgi:hypothetical protein